MRMINPRGRVIMTNVWRVECDGAIRHSSSSPEPFDSDRFDDLLKHFGIDRYAVMDYSDWCEYVLRGGWPP